MHLTIKETEEYLLQMTAYMLELYVAGDKEKSLEILEFILKISSEIKGNYSSLKNIKYIIQNAIFRFLKIVTNTVDTEIFFEIFRKELKNLEIDFIKQNLTPVLLNFYKNNRNSIPKEKFLRRILQNTLWLLPRKDNIAYKLKQEIILELGKELIYNLWLEDFAYFLKLIKNYSVYSDEDFYYNLIIIWGIYTFYLLTEEDKLYSAGKKKILLENLPTLEIDDDFSKRTFYQELESALEHIWEISNNKLLSLEEIIKKFDDSILHKWEIYPEFGGKWVEMKPTIESFFLFNLITPIGNYWVEKIINRTNSQHLILKLISLIDLNDSIGIYKTFKESFKKYTTLIGYSLEIPKISSFYFLPKKEEERLRKLENLKRKINDILRLSLKRFIELDLEESIKNLNSQKLKLKFEEWKSYCKELKDSCKKEYKSYYEIYEIPISSLNNILVGIPSKEHCLKIYVCKLSEEECKELFLNKVASMQLLNRQQTLGELYPNLLKELFEELLTQNEEFKAKFKEWCSKESKLILYF